MANNDKFKANLSRAVSDMKDGVINAMKLGVAAIKEESQKRTPVDTGNLKGGHYTNVQADDKGVTATVGTTAEYAIYVHENLESHHTVGEAKFLENALNDKKDDVLKLVQKMAKV